MAQHGKPDPPSRDEAGDRHRCPEDPPTPAPEMSEADAAMVRKVAGASFGDRALFDLPSGRTISGAEMRRLVAGRH